MNGEGEDMGAPGFPEVWPRVGGRGEGRAEAESQKIGKV